MRDSGGVLGEATATGAAPGVVTLAEPDCGGDDKAILDVVVRGVGSDRVADAYVLTRTGNF